MSAKRYFSIDEANSIVPLLEVHFGKVMQLRMQLSDVYAELEQMGYAPDPDSPSVPGAPDLARRKLGLFHALLESLAEEISIIETTGVAVKDLDLGLCDFLGQKNGHDVWLCWQFGEKEIGFYHDLDTGFSHRVPLDERGAQTSWVH